MKYKPLIFVISALLLTCCSGKSNNTGSGSSNNTGSGSSNKQSDHKSSALLEHIVELSNNIQYVPVFESDQGNAPAVRRMSLTTNASVDYSKNNPTYSPLRTLEVKGANEKIEYLKDMRRTIIDNTYMVDRWIKINNKDDLGPEQKDEYKRISFDKTLDIAKLEYVSQSKTHVEGDWDDEITKYIFLKSSYDQNNKLVINGCETRITWFKNAVREDRGYYQSSFTYLEDSYLNYLTESDVTFSDYDNRSHAISLMSADLTKETPVLTYLNSEEISFLSTGETSAFFLNSTLYDEGKIGFNNSFERHRAISGFADLGQQQLLFQDRFGKSVCEFIRHDYETNGGMFLLDLTEMDGYKSFIGTDTEIVLTLNNDRQIKIVDIEEEGDSKSGTSQGIRINYPRCRLDVSFDFSSMLEIRITPKDEDPIKLQELLFQALQDLQIYFKNANELDDKFKVLDELEDVSSNYPYYGGNVLEQVSFEQAEGIFKKYVDNDVKSFDEVRALDFSTAIDEDAQQDDEGAYSIYSTRPAGQVSFDKNTKKIDLSSVSVTLEPNPLMKRGDEFTFVAALKAETGGVYRVLDTVSSPFEGEDVTFTLHNNISLPELDYGAYRLVCYLLDPNGNKVSTLFYPAYNGEEVTEFDNNKNITNIRNKDGFFVSYETKLLGEQSLMINVAHGEYSFDIGDGNPLVLAGQLYTVSGPHAYINTSYYLEGKQVSLTLYAVSGDNKIPLISKSGTYGANGSLELAEDLFMYYEGQLVQLKSNLPSGTYTFALELIVGENEYVEEINACNCEVVLEETIETMHNIEQNQQENNFVLTVNQLY